MNVLIFADELDGGGWQGQQLKKAFEQRGVKVFFTSLKDCYFDFSSTQQLRQFNLKVPCLENALPDAVFVRGIAGGTLQQVITRLNFLHAFSMLGVKVYNNGRVIERTVDKSMTSFLLHQHGLAMPRTWVCESRQQAEIIISQEVKANQKIVIKPLFGSQGKGVRLLSINDEIPVPMQQFVDGVYYLQSFIGSQLNQWHDYRVFVVNGKAIAAMKRYGETWVNNVAQGGRCEQVSINSGLAELAEQASKALDADYCGVDIIQNEEGDFFVLEVNGIPAWRGLQSVVEIDIAQALVDDFLSKL